PASRVVSARASAAVAPLATVARSSTDRAVMVWSTPGGDGTFLRGIARGTTGGAVDSNRGDDPLDLFERGRHALGGVGAHRSEPEHRPLVVLADVPAFAHQRPALDRLELVAPDSAARKLADEAGRPALPGDAAVLLVLDDGADHRVADPQLHRHAEGGPQAEFLRCARLHLANGARPVDLGMPSRVGHQGEDGRRTRRDAPLHRNDITLHEVHLPIVCRPDRSLGPGYGWDTRMASSWRADDPLARRRRRARRDRPGPGHAGRTSRPPAGPSTGADGPALRPTGRQHRLPAVGRQGRSLDP